MLTIGCHLSISKGYAAIVREAHDIDANTFAFFTRNPRGGDLKPLDARDMAECRQLLEEYHLDMVVLTCGINGSYVFAPNQKSFMETPEVEVADTVGAGDSFTGAFAASLLAGHTIQEAHQLAVKVSAFICTQKGAMHKFSK